MVAAPEAIPPNPNTAATIARTKKIKAHHNIFVSSFGISHDICIILSTLIDLPGEQLGYRYR